MYYMFNNRGTYDPSSIYSKQRKISCIKLIASSMMRFKIHRINTSDTAYIGLPRTSLLFYLFKIVKNRINKTNTNHITTTTTNAHYS